MLTLQQRAPNGSEGDVKQGGLIGRTLVLNDDRMAAVAF